ncbi:MAG: hypothetical protein ACK4QP_23565 [Pseudorhizobium sp.]
MILVVENAAQAGFTEGYGIGQGAESTQFPKTQLRWMEDNETESRERMSYRIASHDGEDEEARGFAGPNRHQTSTSSIS